MIFAVVWTDHALDDLADVWVAAAPADRDRIEAALRTINSELTNDPTTFGESRQDEDRRIAYVPTAAVVFRCDRAARTVRVNHVWVRR